ncbi:MAG TPA: hypothetical protein VJH33_01900 [Candidatus Paceibacterota bacterium]
MNVPISGLLQFSKNVTSEHGEDGILEHVFSVIGDGSRSCVELGALNGKHGSNVWRLIKEQHWSGILIEADPTYFEVLKREYAGTNTICLNRFVSFEGKDALGRTLSETSLPRQFDLLSLDIDGNDYHVWESLTEYMSRVAVIEFNPSIPNDVHFIQARDMGVQQGSSLKAIVELGKKKGYELVAVTETNAIFVLRELFPKCAIGDNSITVLHTDRRFETNLFQLYDGTLKITGTTHLIWHKLPIDEEKLQVLPLWRRVYPAGTSASGWVRYLKYWVRKLPFYALLQRLRKSI